MRSSGEFELDEHGKPIKCFGIHQDITEQKKAEQTLRASEALNRAILDNSPIGISVRSKTGQLLSANAAWQKIWAIPESTLFEDTSQKRQALNFDDRDNYLKPYQAEVRRVYEQGGYLHLPELKPGHPRPGGAAWISQHFYAIKNEQGEVERVVILTEDITDRKKAEDVLRESEERFRILFDKAPLGYQSLDLDGNFLDVNQAWLDMLGYTRQEVLGRWFGEFLTPQYADAFQQRFPIFKAAGQSHSEFEMLRKDGKQRLIAFEGRIGYSLHGDFKQTHCILEDITERKQAEDALKEYNAQLETAVEARTHELLEAQEKLVRQEKLAVLGQLAGGVGHELRNPLAVILNAVYYLKLIQPDADEKVKQYLEIIEQDTHNAEKIVRDLLDFARIQSVDKEPVIIADLIEQTLARYQTPAKVNFKLELPDNLPKAYIDHRQITQVLGNLVVNGCQAMPDGGLLNIFVTLQNDMICIHIQDTGVGIITENMEKLFEPLFTTKAKGIGLGLAVSKKLVEANGGKIEVQSKPGEGSTFSLYLPTRE